MERYFSLFASSTAIEVGGRPSFSPEEPEDRFLCFRREGQEGLGEPQNKLKIIGFIEYRSGSDRWGLLCPRDAPSLSNGGWLSRVAQKLDSCVKTTRRPRLRQPCLWPLHKVTYTAGPIVIYRTLAQKHKQQLLGRTSGILSPISSILEKQLLF